MQRWMMLRSTSSVSWESNVARFELNKLYPKLENQFQLWIRNDAGGWNVEYIPPHPTDGYSVRYLEEVFNKQVRVMPNCPAKIMRIAESWGN
jgi:hypothetical protein